MGDGIARGGMRPTNSPLARQSRNPRQDYHSQAFTPRISYKKYSCSNIAFRVAQNGGV